MTYCADDPVLRKVVTMNAKVSSHIRNATATTGGLAVDLTGVKPRALSTVVSPLSSPQVQHDNAVGGQTHSGA